MHSMHVHMHMLPRAWRGAPLQYPSTLVPPHRCTSVPKQHLCGTSAPLRCLCNSAAPLRHLCTSAPLPAGCRAQASAAAGDAAAAVLQERARHPPRLEASRHGVGGGRRRLPPTLTLTLTLTPHTRPQPRPKPGSNPDPNPNPNPRSTPNPGIALGARLRGQARPSGSAASHGLRGRLPLPLSTQRPGGAIGKVTLK